MPVDQRSRGLLHRLQSRSSDLQQPSDLIRSPLDRQLQRLIDMDVILRHVLGGVSEHCADRKFRKTELASDAPERMPQGVGCDPRNPREFANTVQTGAYSGVGAGPSFRRENVRVSDDFRLTLDYFERCGPNCADLRAALGVRETDKSARCIDPGSLHGLRLFPAITGQKERLQDTQRNRILMILLGIGKGLPEHLDLGNTQSPGSLLAGQFFGALGGMVGLSIGVQSGPPIGVQKGPPCSCGDWLMLGACFALLAA